MLANYHGQVLNYSELGRSFGISDMTAKKYIDILQGTFMVRVLQPWHANIAKRVVKNPKLYIRDSGIFHSLLSISSKEALDISPKLGASWEGFALEETVKCLGKRQEDLFFWMTHSGAELDLFWLHDGKSYGVEFKYSDAPTITKSMRSARSDLDLAHLWVVYPGKEGYSLEKNVPVLPVSHLDAIAGSLK